MLRSHKRITWKWIFSNDILRPIYVPDMFLKQNARLGLFKQEILQDGTRIVQLTYGGHNYVFLDPEFFCQLLKEIWVCETCIFRLGTDPLDYTCAAHDYEDDYPSDYPFVADCSDFIPQKRFLGKIVYFSHSLMEYNTEEENAAISVLKQHFPGYFILNPKIIEYRYSMSPYLFLVRKSDILVFKRYKGYITSGVGMEIGLAFKQGIPVYEITENGSLRRVLEEPTDKLTREETNRLYSTGHI